MAIKALTFDTGGTVLDWHGGLVKAFARVAARHGMQGDWPSLANDWRRRTMKGIVGQRLPDFHMDDVHRRTLDETLTSFGLDTFSTADRLELWHNRITWDAIISCEMIGVYKPHAEAYQPAARHRRRIRGLARPSS